MTADPRLASDGVAPAWEDRESWLSLLQELFDPATMERLERVGVAAGWHVLEVGAGKGSIAAWLARRVGAAGRVVATDVDTGFLERLTEPNLEVRRHDVLSDDLPAERFDLVCCRALLVHLTEPERAIERMARWLKPGGVLFAEEPWTDAGHLSHDPTVARAGRALTKLMDGGLARRLPVILRRAGLERIEAEGRLDFFKGGTQRAFFELLVLEGAWKPRVAAGSVECEELERLRARFDDPDWSDFGSPRIAAWGWKPG